MALSNPQRRACATYSLRDMADLLGISYGSAYQAMVTGRLPVKPFKVGRQWRFPKADVDRLLGLVDRGGEVTRLSA